jgi:saccharopine dehydrogenase-like NADP-dependent oxidoreductase
VGLRDKGNSIFVIGGGRIGLAVVRDLVSSQLIDAIEVGDVDPSRAENLVRELESRKISVVKVDLTNRRELVAAIMGSKVLINAA